MSRTIQCFLVEQSSAGTVSSSVISQPVPVLTDGAVRLRVEYSSLNYKDAMAATGHPGIVKQFPHVPGIDAVGTVLESRHADYAPGDVVIATGHEIGVEQWGGWASELVTRGDWLVPLPAALSPIDVMTLGTAGFTAAQCVLALLKHGCTASDGPVIVSGATGGVGSLAVMLLAQLGFEVTAVTGKADRHDWLGELGAKHVTDREFLSSDASRALLKSEFRAGIDTVGGGVLATMLKRIQHRGCVACCGVAGGGELPTTVYPFILRGIALYGIDSAWCPDEIRVDIWQRLADAWKLPGLERVRVDLTLQNVKQAVDQMLSGKFAGRGVLHIS